MTKRTRKQAKTKSRRRLSPHGRTVRAHYKLYAEEMRSKGSNPLPMDLWSISALRTHKGNSKLIEALKHYTRSLRIAMAQQATDELERKAEEDGIAPLVKATPATDEDLERDPTQLVVFTPTEDSDKRILDALEKASEEIFAKTRRVPGNMILSDPQGLLGRKVTMLCTPEHPNGALYDLETMTPVDHDDKARAPRELEPDADGSRFLDL